MEFRPLDAEVRAALGLAFGEMIRKRLDDADPRDRSALADRVAAQFQMQIDDLGTLRH